MVEGIDDDLLARLALKNPTLLQAELLTSTAAVNTFVGSELSPLLHVDDETLACFASLEPTSVQLQILRTPGSIQAFVNLKMQRGEMPVSSSNRSACCRSGWSRPSPPTCTPLMRLSFSTAVNAM